MIRAPHKYLARKATKRLKHRPHNDWKWQSLSRRFRELNPLCHDCLKSGIVRFSEETHHKIKVSEAPELFYTENNLMALCKSCHSKRSARGE